MPPNSLSKSKGMGIYYVELAPSLPGAYPILQGIYRLYFHPLRHTPSPKLAITYFYGFYHNCIHHGKFLFEIERIRRVYNMFLVPRRGTSKILRVFN